MTLVFELKRLWAYRHYVISAIVSEFKARFANSILGGAWMILSPLAMVAIYTLVLSVILAAKLPGIEHAYAYPVYLVSGILAWTVFTDVLTRMTQVFVEFGNVLKKMAVPKFAVLFIVMGSAYMNALILWLVTVGLMTALGVELTIWVLAVPLFLLVTTALAGALGALAALIHVFARDVGHILPVVLQLAFWMTPIVYTREMVPASFQWIVDHHPLVPMVQLFQDSVAYGVAPNVTVFALYGLVSLLLWLGFWVLYRRAISEVMDAL